MVQDYFSVHTLKFQTKSNITSEIFPLLQLTINADTSFFSCKIVTTNVSIINFIVPFDFSMYLVCTHLELVYSYFLHI